MRTHIYVDGLNLYYQALKGTPYKWLDLTSLFRGILKPHHDLKKIKYFTAQISPRPNNPSSPQRQDTYLRALKSYCDEVEVTYGFFQSHRITAKLATPLDGYEYVEVIRTEEKKSDVNLAVHLLNDAWLNTYDCAVVVSNDSDLSEGMRLVKEHTNKLLGLYTPGSRHPSQHLLKYADFHRHIRKNALVYNQLPNPIPGTTIHKPERW